MRKNSKVILMIGLLLIAVSFLLLLKLQIQTKRAMRTDAEVVQIMESILTDRREGEEDAERDAEMPALELSGQDFIALLEMPSYGLKLPVCGTWDKGNVTSYPCRFCGSAYNGSLVIGGYDQPGQFDFFDRIPTGTPVTVTDMTGSEFSYVVEQVERSNSAQAEVLIDGESDLTLFVRDAQLLEYIILRCVLR